MTTTTDLKWGSYKNREGVYFPGKVPFVLAKDASFEAVALYVIAATESAHYDAVNMYDTCTFTGGFNQHCERFHAVSQLLGAVSTHKPTALDGFRAWLDVLHVEFIHAFRSGSPTSWWFVMDGAFVEDDAAQRRLFYGVASGELGSWTDAAKARARGWAVAFANIWNDAQAQQAQIAFSAERLMGYVLPGAKHALFDPYAGGAHDEDPKLVHAVQAAYLSFAANNPAKAAEQLLDFLEDPSGDPWDEAWVDGLLAKLTFGSGFAIYPGRYDKIRPVLEAQFGVELRDHSEQLKAWLHENGPGPMTIAEMQRALIDCLFDVGPAGADGRDGPKTKAALQGFQLAAGYAPTGILDLATRTALHAAQEAVIGSR